MMSRSRVPSSDLEGNSYLPEGIIKEQLYGTYSGSGSTSQSGARINNGSSWCNITHMRTLNKRVLVNN